MGHTSETAAGTTEAAGDAPHGEALGRAGAEETDDATRDGSPRSAGRAVPLGITVILVTLALVVGYLVGRPSSPLDNSADAGFLRDMSAHHAQAVDMSLIIMDKTADPELGIIAVDIARTQQGQIGIMQGWLTMWGLNSRGAEPPMAWMEGSEHDHGAGEGVVPQTMPGLATEEEMDAFRAAEGVEAEVMFLELMIAHHEGGIDMAQVEVELGREELVTDLAQGMADAQVKEIEAMEAMLADRGVDVAGTGARD
ncbi:DUF305 domain-containing protein [Nocardiopsis sp. CNR-923]|uniref:DUF305 domain-containing protein n=1 Tax=Nocardiopsis sp. CNR-923 TaxID=1904965 RepID=UPI00095E2BA2|nr:DUF305 domain-containing protein [Nocardiopsis sp. CNR-923]OLT26787.1 DUF305 domain-containing protein [Nocardiopsis sp. CNR-923]